MLPATAVAGSHMLKGPYLQDLAPTSITIMWQLDTAAPAKVTIDGPGGIRMIDVSAARIAEATIDKLAPSSRYRYRVTVDDQEFNGEFATAPQVGSEVPFA